MRNEIMKKWENLFGTPKVKLAQVNDLCANYGKDAVADFANEKIKCVKWEPTIPARFELVVYADDIASYICGGAK